MRTPDHFTVSATENGTFVVFVDEGQYLLETSDPAETERIRAEVSKAVRAGRDTRINMPDPESEATR